MSVWRLNGRVRLVFSSLIDGDQLQLRHKKTDRKRNNSPPPDRSVKTDDHDATERGGINHSILHPGPETDRGGRPRRTCAPLVFGVPLTSAGGVLGQKQSVIKMCSQHGRRGQTAPHSELSLQIKGAEA